MGSRVNLHFVLHCIKPTLWWLLGDIVVYFIWAIDVGLRPYLLKVMLDRIPTLTSESAIAQLAAPAAFYIAMGLLVVIIFRIHDIMWLTVNPQLRSHIGDLLMKRVMQHGQALFQNQLAGNLGNKIKEVMAAIPDLLKLSLEQFVSKFLALLIAIVTLWCINQKFAVLLSLWVTVFILISLLFAKNSKSLNQAAADIRSQISGKIIDILSNILTVHLFSNRHFESQTLKKQFDQQAVADQKRDWYFLKMIFIQAISFLIYQAVTVLILMQGFKNSQVSAGDFVLILSVNSGIMYILWLFAADINRAAELLGNITQGLEIVLAPLAIVDQPQAASLQIRQGSIVFDRVTFQYPGAELLFQEKSVVIQAGQKVGLVGYSGSGKSTFVNLILRLYDVTGGAVLIDDQDIRQVTQDSLRSAIGMIPQDPLLFHRSLRENIRYGRLEATDSEVITAAKGAHADEFITQLPQQYDALVGERGVKLSGGQRQRIAIARALLKNAPILILDEATSQLDSVTEKAIQQALEHLMQEKTTLVIAHRLSTLLQMDRILVFSEGQIIEDGPHPVLLAKGGLYKTLWDTQVGGWLTLQVNDDKGDFEQSIENPL